MSPLQPTKGSGGASWAPPAGSGAEPRPKTRFWRILKATERSFLYLYDKIWGGGQFVLASPLQILGGDLSPCPPRDLRPCTRNCQGITAGIAKHMMIFLRLSGIDKGNIPIALGQCEAVGLVNHASSHRSSNDAASAPASAH